MKVQLRAVLVGALAFTMVGVSFASPARAVVAGPTFVSAAFDVAPVNEGQLVTLSGQYSDPDQMPVVTVDWGGTQAQESVSPPFGVETFSFSTVYKDDGRTGTPQDTYTVTLWLDDGWNAPVQQTLTLVVRNVAPTVTMTASAAQLLDHDTLFVSGSFTDPGVLDTFQASVDWGDGTSAWTHSYKATDAKTFSPSHQYLVPGTYTVTSTVTDDDTGVGTAQLTLLVQSPNHAPTTLVLTPGTASEGASAGLSATFADLDSSDTHRIALTWGDGTPVETHDLAAGLLAFSGSHVFASTGTYYVDATVTDAAGASTTAGATFVVANVAPTATLSVSSSSVLEGDTVTVNVTVHDPGVKDTFTATFDFGDGSAPLAQSVSAGAFSVSHQFTTAGTPTVSVSVTDPDGGRGTASAPLTVQAPNHAPGDLALSANAVSEGGSATLSGSFSDLDANDTHTVTIKWGDGSPVAHLSLGTGVTSFSATHVFSTAGGYTLGATVSDAAGAAVTSTTTLTVNAVTNQQVMDGLLAILRSLPLDSGTKNSLLTKVDDTCNAMKTLSNEISAQNGKKLTTDQVRLVTAEMTKLSALLSCPEGTVNTAKTNAAPTTAPRTTTRR
ncbi:MAG TPA: PKD domain-containing protein [Candidatus Limnocylindria bacterium]|nr:PKD domain-containing protein [Candidatus Limnocylindria bacterium]